MQHITVAVALVVTFLFEPHSAAHSVDPNGYIVFCPCMGRFGNQADQFLGAIAFARALNRTLVLPAWVEYHRHSIKSVQIPFDRYFKVEPLRAYLKVMLMEDFMKDLAPTVWPPGKRIAFCYSARRTIASGERTGCNPKDGNPFESFWDTYGVDFDESTYYGPLYYTTDSPKEMRRWTEKYPPSEFPVLAFSGTPAAFPVQEHNVKLHKYIQWSDAMVKKAQDFIDSKISTRPFIGLHLRNGIDFKGACDGIKQTPSMFAAAQCIGYRSQYGTTSYEMCYPDDDTVVKQVKKEVKVHGAKTVFIATDDRDLISKFSKAMKKVTFVRQNAPSDPMLDLAILGQADHFIGNCISTFSAFVKRERDVNNKTSSFWAFTPKEQRDSRSKQEL